MNRFEEKDETYITTTFEHKEKPLSDLLKEFAYGRLTQQQEDLLLSLFAQVVERLKKEFDNKYKTHKFSEDIINEIFGDLK